MKFQYKFFNVYQVFIGLALINEKALGKPEGFFKYVTWQKEEIEKGGNKMTITDLIPWKKERSNVLIRREQGDDPLIDLRFQMNRLFDDFFGHSFSLSPFFGETTFLGDFTPKMDVTETDKEITITAELPGLEPKDVQVTMDRNTLTISGEKRAEREENGKRFYRVERSYGSFRRTIPLPEEVDENKVEATFKRGVLKIQLPISAEAKKKRKLITINSA